MNTKIDDGGPAFPILDKANFCGTGSGDGMDLRDYFAAAAMQGMLADSQTRQSCPEGKAEEWTRSFARVCYDFADAMIKVREERVS